MNLIRVMPAEGAIFMTETITRSDRADAATCSVRVNEREMAIAPGTSALVLRDQVKPDADIVIYNGFPLSADRELAEGDELVLIRRGEVPAEDEMEALLTSRHGPGVHAKVKRAHIGIAGCGGLGSAVAVALARTGIGALTLVDFDVVEPSNLNRQQFFTDQIGQPKVEALAENLKRMNPYVRIETRHERLSRDTIATAFSGCGILAECFDDPFMKREMTIAARRDMADTPLVTVSGIAGFGPSQEIGIRRVFDNIWLVGDAGTAAQPGRGLLAPRVAVAAGHQANVILRLVLGEAPLGEEETHAD
jgi:sulfur carrier protein ThiS adenylyltransferase